MRSPYGNGGTPRDLAMVNYRTAPRAHGLRSANAVYGWYADKGGKRVHRRPSNVNTDTNLVEPVVEDAPIRKYQRTDYDAERKSVGTIRMADF
jgi:hypothetical protein